ncbi:replication initiation protein, RepL2 [Streptomyces sp. NPDC017941]|uniref:replication initiation protein, RepL2 n=1 Tax=Streptomyces sp. NPDC017941 TaxID=3365018 RepID=UPI0037ABEE38
MNIECREEVVYLLKRTSELPPLQRIVILLYASKDQTDTGTVPETAAAMAEELGMLPQLFTRVRRQLIDGGWLEEDAAMRIGKVKYYRLTPKATGGTSNVIPLRSA